MRRPSPAIRHFSTPCMAWRAFTRTPSSTTKPSLSPIASPNSILMTFSPTPACRSFINARAWFPRRKPRPTRRASSGGSSNSSRARRLKREVSRPPHPQGSRQTPPCLLPIADGSRNLSQTVALLGPATLVAGRNSFRGDRRRHPHPEHFVDERRTGAGKPSSGWRAERGRHPRVAFGRTRTIGALVGLLSSKGAAAQELHRVSG